MFTGIVEEIGTVVSLRREGSVARLAIRAQTVREELHVGDSLSASGACLTVERIEPAQIRLSMMAETLGRTTLGALSAGAQVNLERALRADGRLGGHILAGHVDGVGALQSVIGSGEGRVYVFSMPRELARFVAPKGSIAVDGVSLTVVNAGEETFSVALIRHTLTVTTLASLPVGSPVNIEVDLIARYLDRLLAAREAGGGLTLETLRELGY